MLKKMLLFSLAFTLCCVPLSSCQSADPTPTPIPSDKPTDVPTLIPTETPTPTVGYDYTYPKDEYTKEIAVFEKQSDVFAPGERTQYKTVETNYNDTVGCYITTRAAFTVDGVRTYASIDRPYSPAIHTNVDAYAVNSEFILDYQKAGYDTLIAHTSFTKCSAYASAHPEIVQKNAEGESGSYWNNIVLTDKVMNYIFQNTLRAADRKDIYQIGLAEPEMFRGGTYAEAFQELWETKYGIAFEDPYSSVDAMFRSQRLSVWTVTNAIRYYVSKLTEKTATFNRFSVLPHSTLAYSIIDDGVTDGYVHMMGTGLVRAVTGQTWSNTMENAIPYAGKSYKDPFINGLVDYGTYLDAADYYGADFFALCDPMSDTAKAGEEDYWRSLCHMQLVASMMYPEINRWELIWTNRSFLNVSASYRSEQLNIHNALLDISGQAYYGVGGTTGITYLLSDSLTWQSRKQTEWGGNPYNGFWGVVGPLVYDGILPRTRAMELITSAADLDGIEVLIVSYDNQKPIYPEVNTAIAEWVKAGGTLLCLGGPDEYLNIEDAWWQSAEGGSPVGNLLSCLGLDVTEETYVGNTSALTWAESSSADTVGNIAACKISNNARTYTFNCNGNGNGNGNGIEPLLTSADGQTIGFTAAVGQGSVIFAGVATESLSASESGAELMRALTRRALADAKLPYVTSDVYYAERGEYVLLYPMTQDYTLDGTFIRIFSDDLCVETDPTVKAGEAALFLRAETKDVPTVAYAGGVWESVSETKNTTVYTFTAAENALASARIIAPEGLYPNEITVRYANGSLAQPVYRWDAASHSLVVQAFATPTNAATVTVTWSESESGLPSCRFENHTIAVNQSGEDKAYIVSNTGGANGEYRYADGNAQIVWKFDVSEYEGLQLSVGLINNYLLEASADGKTWEKVLDFAQIARERASGTNQNVANIVADDYTDENGTLYVRISNNSPSQGWGGGVRFFDLQYIVYD